MMLYLLTFMTCMGSECTSMWIEQKTLEDCLAMKHRVIAEARQDARRVVALCTLNERED